MEVTEIALTTRGKFCKFLIIEKVGAERGREIEFRQRSEFSINADAVSIFFDRINRKLNKAKR